MARIRELVETALASGQPAPSVEALVRDLISGGETREAIAEELDSLVMVRRVQGDEAGEKILLEILDRLRGWCSPDARL